MRDALEVIEQEIHNAGDAPIVACLAWRILAALRDEYEVSCNVSGPAAAVLALHDHLTGMADGCLVVTGDLAAARARLAPPNADTPYAVTRCVKRDGTRTLVVTGDIDELERRLAPENADAPRDGGASSAEHGARPGCPEQDTTPSGDARTRAMAAVMHNGLCMLRGSGCVNGAAAAVDALLAAGWRPPADDAAILRDALAAVEEDTDA